MLRWIIGETDYGKTESNLVRCPDESAAEKMIIEIENARLAGDSLGGMITCHVNNMPLGLGEPIFDRLEADLAKGMMGIAIPHHAIRTIPITKNPVGHTKADNRFFVWKPHLSNRLESHRTRHMI